ncbi:MULTISPECIES: nucleotidyltransferase domain-containing protein [Corallincola]|uniref:DUF4037 domain-containing protein n=3 Tax=Corallincola TaxID=1775176 RepID=A0A368NHG5_9GAMM|nr:MULTISPECIES: nucleotidyltransferase domain-containing protein [Corallincola]RCU49175.1 DUF4037 domain-containing protein [Corallincola holothuriorum]TAA47525.1 DUF4037 domain-containing protein [Corallincola spongiicola]TCI05207.1 DUF4037 domain-containing protein [Corallincola luteus]
MAYSDCFNDLIREFSELPQVDAILLAGSRGAERADPDSDYDVYVYLNRALPVEQRKAITDRHCQMMELNNQFWETEDDGVLNDGVEIELIYRGLEWLEGELSRVVELHQVGVGYTTCFWANLLDSKILFDRTGKATELQSRFNVPYPPLLKQAIVDKCFPLMKAQIPAYYHQLKKALKREDRISVNHRIAEMLAAYFDMLFAVNEIPHPGEKRMLSLLLAKGNKFPVGLQDDLQQLLEGAATGGEELLAVVERMTIALQTLLEQEGLK